MFYIHTLKKTKLKILTEINIVTVKKSTFLRTLFLKKIKTVNFINNSVNITI